MFVYAQRSLTGLRQDYVLMHASSLPAGAARCTRPVSLDEIEEDPATAEFERIVNLHHVRLHKKAIHNPATKKFVMAKKASRQKMDKLVEFPTEHRPILRGRYPRWQAADDGNSPRSGQEPERHLGGAGHWAAS